MKKTLVIMIALVILIMGIVAVRINVNDVDIETISDEYIMNRYIDDEFGDGYYGEIYINPFSDSDEYFCFRVYDSESNLTDMGVMVLRSHYAHLYKNS